MLGITCMALHHESDVQPDKRDARLETWAGKRSTVRSRWGMKHFKDEALDRLLTEEEAKQISVRPGPGLDENSIYALPTPKGLGMAMARILICDPLQKRALEIMGERHQVVDMPHITREELLEKVADVDAIVVRARTNVDSEVIARGRRLKVIARAGVGTDNIDVDAATQMGVLVVNSPDPSINAVAEHTFALLLGVCRRIVKAHESARAGEAGKTELVGTEISGKTLGIVGLGRIGTRVAMIAKGFGLNTIAADPYASPAYAEKHGAELVALHELLKRSDFVTLHVPLTDSTRNLIGKRELDMMKPTAILINTSRAGIVDNDALVDALKRRRIAGAGLDVFDEECAEELASLENVLMTPHIGASTKEAQSQIAELIATEVVDALEGKPTRNPVNMPHVDRKALELLQPYLHLTDRMVRVVSRFLAGNPNLISISLFGEASEIEHPDFLLRSVVVGILSPFHEVNIVNAMATADRMGIKTEISKGTGRDSYLSSIEIKIGTSEDTYAIKGALVDSDKPRIVGLLGYELEFVPAGHILITQHMDVPGMVGMVGTKLGSAGVNIATMQLARKRIGEQAMMVIQTDKEAQADLVQEIGRIKGVSKVVAMSL